MSHNADLNTIIGLPRGKGKAEMTCIRCKHDTAKKFGTYGKRRIQRYRCSSCRTTFSDPAPKLGTHYTAPETAATALSMMLEGVSIRAISRLTGLHIQTVLDLMNTAAVNAGKSSIPWSATFVRSSSNWMSFGAWWDVTASESRLNPLPIEETPGRGLRWTLTPR